MPHGKAIKNPAPMLPVGHEPVHQRLKPFVVRWLQYVNHLVDHDVFQAFAWLLGEIRVQPNGTGLRIAAAPARFHPPHIEAGNESFDSGRIESNWLWTIGRLPSPFRPLWLTNMPISAIAVVQLNSADEDPSRKFVA